MNARQPRVARGRGGSPPRVRLTRMPDRFSRLPSAAPLPASPRAVCRRQPVIFPSLLSLPWAFSPTNSARVRAQRESVAKAERKQPVPSPDVLAAACEMSHCGLPAARGGCLVGCVGLGTESFEKRIPLSYWEAVGLLLSQRSSLPLCPGGGHSLAG